MTNTDSWILAAAVLLLALHTHTPTVTQTLSSADVDVSVVGRDRHDRQRETENKNQIAPLSELRSLVLLHPLGQTHLKSKKGKQVEFGPQLLRIELPPLV